MDLVLGIDTGGTFTDSVIYDLVSQKIVTKAKALTTYDDLAKGIRNSISALSFNNFEKIKLVSLSTTMATNAIVEGRGSEVGLILIGEKPNGHLPVQHYEIVPGKFDIKGFTTENLDFKKVEEVIEKFKKKVAAIAISGFASVRNPEHEIKVKELVKEKTHLPVVCGHELTTSLGFHERTVTAVLNAKLIPIITGLISSVKTVLAEMDIKSPLMIVKGDGTLMAESLAMEKPIKTILSGPAASIIGATTMTNTSDALVLDMGGTTTDIAIVRDGIPRINSEGATVGGWLTRVEAADVYTYGLGGDSRIWINKNKQLNIGPQKVWPLSFVGSKYPYLTEELKLQKRNLVRLKTSHASDSYILIRKYDPKSVTQTEKKALEILETGPHTLFYLANSLEKNPFSFELERLVKLGIIAKAAVTPTDILHIMGIFNKWNKETALNGITILTDILEISLNNFIELAYESIIDNLCLNILESALKFEGVKSDLTKNLKTNYLIKKFFSSNSRDIINASVNLNIPLIGIGAPVKAYLPKVAEKINCELFIPENSDVANAVGAAAGKVMEKIKMVISPSFEGYNFYSQWERKNFDNLNEAKAYALEQAEKQARILAEKAGATNYEIMKDCKDIYSKAGARQLVETIIEVTVIGRPKW